MKRLLIRVDGSPALGLGHVMRCVAFAEAAQRSGTPVRFVVGPEPAPVAALRRRGFPAVALRRSSDLEWLGEVGGGDVLLFDGYHFTRPLFEAAAASPATVAVMDDTSVTDLVDVVVAPEMGADHGLRGPVVLAGVAYTPIRQEFLALRRHRDGSGAGPLLVAMGGSDPLGLTAPVVAAALGAGVSWFDGVLVVVGPAAGGPPFPAAGRAGVEVLTDPAAVAPEFDRSVAAVSAAGGTALELMCLGVPGAYLEVNESQSLISAAAAGCGAGIALGRGAGAVAAVPAALLALADPATRSDMSRAALDYVDGGGAGRVLEALASL